MHNVGIDLLSFYAPTEYLDLADLADARGVAPEKYEIGLDQRLMSVPAADEDAVTMAAAAALPLLEQTDPSRIGALLVGTESAVDHSKATAAFVHRLLGLPATCMIYDVRQACAAGTIGLRQAAAMVALEPEMTALVIATDIAHYAANSPGEPTQGAGACALLVSANPRVCRVEPTWGVHAEETSDFWRPISRDTPVVNGKTSLLKYLECLRGARRHFIASGGDGKLRSHCFHLPFASMAHKAAKQVARDAGAGPSYRASLQYGRVIGNTYTASLYIALASLLEQGDVDDGERIGMYSYGSGSLGLYFALQTVQGFRDHLLKRSHTQMLARRHPLSLASYEARHARSGNPPQEVSDSESPFRWVGVDELRRMYEPRAAGIGVASDAAWVSESG